MFDKEIFHAEDYNLIKNSYLGFDEIILFNDNKTMFSGVKVDKVTGEVYSDLKNTLVRKRKYKDCDGVLVPLEENLTCIQSLQKTLKSSRKRALDNLFGYALSNKWQYWVTLTTDSKKVDREDEEQVKYIWKLFRQKTQRVNKDVQILCIPERHPTSSLLHFHCLMNNIDLSDYLTKAVNPHTNKVIRSHGRLVYNLNLYDFGFSTVVKVSGGSELIIANYLSKYVVKDFGNLGYNKKSFYTTHNLNFKNKQFKYLTTYDKIDFMNTFKGFLYKTTDNCKIYRIFKK